MAADLFIELACYEKALLGTRPRAERARQQRQSFAERRLGRRSAPEYGGAQVRRRVLDEASRFAGPRRIENRFLAAEREARARALPLRPSSTAGPLSLPQL